MQLKTNNPFAAIALFMGIIFLLCGFYKAAIVSISISILQLLYGNLKRLHHDYYLWRLAIMPISLLTDGLAKIKGNAISHKNHPSFIINGKSCIAYYTKLYRMIPDQKRNGKVKVECLSSTFEGNDFYVQDVSGRILVRPSMLSLEGLTSQRVIINDDEYRDDYYLAEGDEVMLIGKIEGTKTKSPYICRDDQYSVFSLYHAINSERLRDITYLGVGTAIFFIAYLMITFVLLFGSFSDNGETLNLSINGFSLSFEMEVESLRWLIERIIASESGWVILITMHITGSLMIGMLLALLTNLRIFSYPLIWIFAVLAIAYLPVMITLFLLAFFAINNIMILTAMLILYGASMLICWVFIHHIVVAYQELMNR